MCAAQWGQQQETGEVGVVYMSAAVVDPRAVMVHLHHASGEERQRTKHIHQLFGGSSVNNTENIIYRCYVILYSLDAKHFFIVLWSFGWSNVKIKTLQQQRS